MNPTRVRLDREERQLVAELAALVNGHAAPPPPDGLDSARFEALGEAQRVSGALARTPGAIDRPALTRLHLRDFALATQIERRRTQAMAAAHEAGVRILVLKGGDWAFRIYPDPGMRPMVDIDLLAAPGEAEATVEALRSIGYRAAPGEENALAGGYTAGLISDEPPGVRIEVHPRLCRASRHPIDVAEIFERSQPLGGGAAGSRMGDADCVVYAAVHHALHGYRMTLLWLVDFALLAHVCGPDDDVNVLAERWGATRALATSRRLAEALFGPLPLPPSPERAVGGRYLRTLITADHLQLNRFANDPAARMSTALALMDRGRLRYLKDSLLRRITKK